jgi:hypothetical protein
MSTGGYLNEIVLLERFDGPEHLDIAEIRWIALGRDALGERLANATYGGGGTRGWHHTAESRKKLKMAASTAESVAKRSTHKKEFWSKLTNEQRLVILAKAHGEMSNRKRIISHKALSKTPKRIKALSLARERSTSIESRERRSASLKAYWDSIKKSGLVESRVARQKKTKSNPEYKKKMSAIFKDRVFSLETRAKISASRKAYFLRLREGKDQKEMQ